MRIARPGINLLVHGKPASASVARNKAGAESNDHTTLPFVGGGFRKAESLLSAYFSWEGAGDP